MAHKSGPDGSSVEISDAVLEIDPALLRSKLLSETRDPYLYCIIVTCNIMASHAQAYEKLHEYTIKIGETEYHTGVTNGKIAYEARLDKTLEVLQNQVKEQQDALQKVVYRRAVSWMFRCAELID